MPASKKLKADQNLLRYLHGFDVAIANHMTWLKRINRVLVCGEAPNPDDLRPDAHRRCKFGIWFHQDIVDALGGDPGYLRVDELHRAMHEMARQVLEQHKSSGKVTVGEYDAFSDSAVAFKGEVRELQFRIINQVCLVDHLTGIWNRYAMFHNLAKEHERLLRGGHPCCVALVDIDHFKRVNDAYDHRVGDTVLQLFTLQLSECLRKYDVIARYGGEEFLICLPHTHVARAQKVLERIRQKIAATPLRLRANQEISLTASFGVAEMSADILLEQCIERADHALLSAKSAGRNRVCAWEEGAF